MDDSPRVVVVADAWAVAVASASVVRDVLTAGKGDQPLHVALTGGSSAEGLFRVLASPPIRDTIPWDRVHLWLGDDRFVGRSDPLSNAGVADRFLFAGPVEGPGEPGVPVDPGHVHPIPCDAALDAGRDAAWCAEIYARELRDLVPADADGWPVFDLLLVGIGSDGHLLSVFPDSAIFDRPEWALPVPAPTHIAPGVPRVTLNPRIIGTARAVLAMSDGPAKADILGTIFGSERDPHRWPAQLALRAGATWVLDEAAAAQLP